MKFRIFTLTLFVAFLALACEDPEPEPTPVTLTANPSSLNFDASGGTRDITITSGIKPTISCSDAWIKLTEGSYASNSLKLSVTAQENTGTTSRSTSIRIIGDKQSLMVSVTQGIPQVKLSVDKTSVSFDRFGGEASFTVTSSEQPTER